MTRPSVKRVPAMAIAVVLSGLAVGAQAPTPSSIVRVAVEGPACSVGGSNPCVVAIEADGPLPAPSGGTLTDPDRVYLDFAATRAKTSGLPRTGGSGIGIRVAVHSDAPLMTRVVIDLPAPASHTLDLSHRGQGRVLVQLTEAHGAAASPGPAARGPASPAIAPAKSASRTPRTYSERIRAVFEAVERMRADLALLDSKSMPAAASLRNDLAQVAAARDALASAKPPATLAAAHAELVSACSLAGMAFESAARDPSGKVAPDTASAAAGALILLERAHAALASIQ